MSIETFLAFILASAVLVALPGPNVTLILANSMSRGTRAGMLTVAGTEAGAAVLLVAMIAGLAPVMALASAWFDWIRLAGAAYLVWMGISKLRSAAASPSDGQAPGRQGHPFWQGFLVLLSNPKVLLFFAAFLPQFMNPAGNVAVQLVLLSVAYLIVATVIDAGYALLAGRARTWLSEQRRRLIDGLSGVMLIGGGIWLALARR
ncbi:MAG: LysE family translocator [Methyloligellaceae bacterium]